MKIYINKILIKYLFLLICMLFVMDVYGGVVTTDWVNIKQIQLGWNVKRVNFRLEQEIENPASCSSTYTASIDEDRVNLEHLYALALTSFASQKEVQFVISDSACSNNGKIKIISIYSKS
ncbi:MAG: hypothetical protein PVI92_16500 [Chromatiales bacterium]|jgi:hypothetical protein